MLGLSSYPDLPCDLCPQRMLGQSIDPGLSCDLCPQSMLGLSSSDPDDSAARPPIDPSLILETIRPEGNGTDDSDPVSLSCRNSVQGIELIADDRGGCRGATGGGKNTGVVHRTPGLNTGLTPGLCSR